MRAIKGQPWTRTSRSRPRKSYVKGVPNTKVRQFNMGTDKRFDLEIDLVSNQSLNIRDNSLESGRQALLKYLERNLIDNFFLTLLVFPHHVIREHSASGVAGADRISKGMKLAFGKPKGRAARIYEGQTIFRIRVMKDALPIVKESCRRGQAKLSSTYTLVIKDISNDPINLRRSIEGVKMKKKIEEVKVVEEVVAAEGAPAVEGEAGKEGAAPAGKEGEKTLAPAAAKPSDSKKPGKK